MPYYRKHGKILIPLTNEEFGEIINTGHFVSSLHKGFLVGLWYFGVRKTELLRAKQEQFTVSESHGVIFSVGKRLKHGIETAPLRIPLEAPFILHLIQAIRESKKGKRVFPFSPRTAFNICDRVGFYPHYFRLSRITNIFNSINPRTKVPFTFAQVRSFTGLTPTSLNYYVGLVDVEAIGESFTEIPRVNP